MKPLCTRLLIVVLAMILMVGGLASCFDDGNIGYEIKYAHGDTITSTKYKITSNGTRFGVDEVTLDFHFGSFGKLGSQNPFYDTDNDAQFFCIALCFYDGQYYPIEALWPRSPWLTFVDGDYHDIESYYFVKTLTRDEFNSEEYYVLVRNLGSDKFNHQETITVPREVFERESGSFIFQITEVWFSQKLNQYCLQVENAIHVNYDYIDEQTIRLSKPANSTPR